MRKKTKYDSVTELHSDAMTVSQYARKYKFSSASYVHVKYDRYKFGYQTKAGSKLFTEHPGYDIVDFRGNCYVINHEC